VAKKSPKNVVTQRVEEVYALRLQGAERHDLIRYAAEKGWGVCERQVENYITKADRLMKKRIDAKADHLLARHLLQRRRLFAEAKEAADHATALRVLQDEARLLNLYPPTKIAPTTPDGKDPWAGWAPALGELDDAELAVLDKLAARARQVAAGDAGNRGN
jgi:hypothetical protein